MGCGDTCSRVVLVIINIIFFLIGIALTTAGVIVKFFPSVYQPSLNEFLQQIPNFSSSAGLEGVTQSSTSSTFDLSTILGDVGVALLIIGVFIMVTALLGLIGACCTVKPLLVIYIIIIVLIVCGQIAAIVIFATGVLDSQIKTTLNGTITASYGGIDDFTPISLSWNFFMVQYKCCGVDSYTDFDGATNWNRNRSITYDGNTQYMTLVTPIACCKSSGTFPSVTPTNSSCAVSPSDSISNWKNGCWNELHSQFNSNSVIIYAVFGSILFFEVLCIVMSICIMCVDDKKSESDYA